ncbi:MAG TPA: hypothetical protein VJ201_05085 [Candidatus Babeliales bacterium]|nr:hypothetical protein [Candidatus Babeliales bacterium]
MVQDRITQHNDEVIIKESKTIRKAEENALQLKLRSFAQADEQTRINKYSEGFCYGCAKIDHIISTVFFICTECYQKRGTEGLLANVSQSHSHQLCDICGFWKMGVWQRNVSFCQSCMRRTMRIHQKYRDGGGRSKLDPFIKRQQRRFGKDYQAILGEGIRKKL